MICSIFIILFEMGGKGRGHIVNKGEGRGFYPSRNIAHVEENPGSFLLSSIPPARFLDEF
jgi:hypothetical protein